MIIVQNYIYEITHSIMLMMIITNGKTVICIRLGHAEVSGRINLQPCAPAETLCGLCIAGGLSFPPELEFSW